MFELLFDIRDVKGLILHLNLFGGELSRHLSECMAMLEG